MADPKPRKRRRAIRSYLFSRDIQALLEKIGVHNCCLVGHSMGGFTALELALEKPQIVSALVLVDTSSGEWDVMPGGSPDMQDKIEALARSEGLGAAFDYEAEHNPVRVERFAKHPAVRDKSRIKALNTSLAGYIYVPRSFQKWRPVTDRLPEINVPSMVFRGEDDTPFIRASNILKEKIRGARLVIVPGAAHNPHEENPAFFNREFLKFIFGLKR